MTGFAPTAAVVPFGDATDRPVAGRLQAPDRSTIGVFRNGTWFVSNDDSSTTGFSFAFGDPGDIPVTGNWTGSGGTATQSLQGPGVFRNGTWFLKNTASSGFADTIVSYGDPGDTPVVGDWNGDGTDTIGVVRGNTWYLRNSNTSGFADIVMTLGDSGDRPVVGDWDGLDNTTTPGVYRNGTWFERNVTASGFADGSFVFGDRGDVPFVLSTP